MKKSYISSLIVVTSLFVGCSDGGSSQGGDGSSSSTQSSQATSSLASNSSSSVSSHSSSSIAPVGVDELIFNDDTSNLWGYTFTSKEVTQGDVSSISLEFECDGTFTQSWTRTYPGLSPNTKKITGSEIHIEEVTGLDTDPVARLRYVGLDKFNQENDGDLYLGKNNHHVLKVNESCFNAYDCDDTNYVLKSIEKTSECN